MKRFSSLIRNFILDTTPFRPSLATNPSNIITTTMASSTAQSTSTPPQTKTPTTTTSPSSSTPSHPPPNLTHPANTTPLTTAQKPVPIVERLNIKVNDTRGGTVPAYLHMNPNHHSTHPPSTAAILLSGAGGGVTGPSGIYLSMADKLAALDAAIPTLRMDYRYPARNAPCCRDVLAGMEYLETAFGISRFVLVGWSFGGAPVFTVGGTDKRVIGCATVASQTAETEGIRKVAPRPVLLLHGTGDGTLSPRCSERLYDMYGERGQREIKFFDGDNHALSRNAGKAEELLVEFVVRCAGERMSEGERKMVGEEMVKGSERDEVMKRGGDLRGGESID